MLAYLDGRVNDRKRRLFLAACCRRVWGMLPDERSRRAVETAERYADGQADHYELMAACIDAVGPGGKGPKNVAWAAYSAACRTLSESIVRQVRDATAEAAARAAATAAHGAGGREQAAAYVAAAAAGAKGQADAIRDLFGNPFRPAAFDPIWLARNGGVVRRMAEAIYAERRFGDLPVLADALEEAGCADAAALNHCRQPGEHVRGCWVLDLLLGKA
jgi:hypothetical protein